MAIWRSAACSVHAANSSRQLISLARSAGRRVAVVSNNSEPSVDKYLVQRGLRSHVAFISARYDALDPALLKPDPHVLRRALERVDARPANAVIVGDSIADIEAGRAAGVLTIGFSTKQAKRVALMQAGADAICDDLIRIAGALVSQPWDGT